MSPSTSLVLVPITIVATSAVVMIVVMIAIGTTVTGKTEATVVTAQDRPAEEEEEATPKIVVPGLHPPGGRMIEGLQGTMIIDGGTMMTEKDLTIVMIAAGMITTAVVMTEDARIEKTDMKTGLQDRRTGMAIGPVERSSDAGANRTTASRGFYVSTRSLAPVFSFVVYGSVHCCVAPLLSCGAPPSCSSYLPNQTW